MKNVLTHLKTLENIIITKIIKNSDHDCIFLKDLEVIDWQIKDYETLDISTNI